MSIASCGSRLPVGSSARMSAGSPTMARAIATRCCSPPESTLRRIAAAPREPDALERLADARADEPRRQPEHLERDRDVLEHGPARHELEVLEDDADVAAQGGDRVVGEARDVASEEEDAPVVDALGAVDEAEQRALARAARAR